MEGRVFERLFEQMRRNYASTRSAAAAIFLLPSVAAQLIIPCFPRWKIERNTYISWMQIKIWISLHPKGEFSLLKSLNWCQGPRIPQKKDLGRQKQTQVVRKWN